MRNTINIRNINIIDGTSSASFSHITINGVPVELNSIGPNMTITNGNYAVGNVNFSSNPNRLLGQKPPEFKMTDKKNDAPTSKSTTIDWL